MAKTPWMCHVCSTCFDGSQTTGNTCQMCYQLACDAHIAHAVLPNAEYGHTELKQVCSRCQATLAGDAGQN